jgi:hypothetical protein
MTKHVHTASRRITLGTAKSETKGVATLFSPDDSLQRKPKPDLAAD